jgi:LysM repeat protein
MSTTVGVFTLLSAVQLSFAADTLSSATQAEYTETNSKSSASTATTSPVTTSTTKSTSSHLNSVAAKTGEFHTVKSGDVLWKIAKAHGMTLDSLIKLNPEIKNPNRIFVGQRIRIVTTAKEQAVAQANAQVAIPRNAEFANGIYRGAYIDGGYQQVGIEFKLLDQKITSISYKTLNYKDINYLKPEAGTKIESLKFQYDELINYLIGKDVRLHLNVLHYPGLIADDRGEGADTVTGATLRSAKVISAINDALNRGVYTRK